MPERPAPAAQQNIESIAKLEQEMLEERNTVDRIADAIGAFAGTITFVIIHVLWFTGWILVNTNSIPGVPAFDPFPFMLLSMCVSMEAVILTTFVLMKQNRMSRRSEQRNQLNLQIDLLAEKEITVILQMVRDIAQHMQIDTRRQRRIEQAAGQGGAHGQP